MRRAFIFPGQGTQTVGMGQELAKAFPEAKRLFEEVDDALEQNLSKIIFEGPEEQLTLTENAQPAIMAVSMAIIRIFQTVDRFKIGSHCMFVAGHSLGEYTALTATQAFRVSDAARLLRERGRAMQDAVPLGKGAMAVLLGIDLSAAEEIAAEASHGEVCVAANDNAPGQIVLSGNSAAIERAVEIGKEKGAKRSRMLAVSAPFHCPLMAPAAEKMAEVLNQTNLNQPVTPIISNVTAAPETQPNEIRKLLVNQVTSKVRWRESIENIRDLGVHTFIEVGMGKVLTGMVKRIDKNLSAMSIQSPKDIENFLSSI